APATATATVFGVVKDIESGEALEAVNIILKDTKIGAMTDESGSYSISGIPPGTYELITSMIGYEHYIETLHLKPGDRVRLNIELKSTVLDYGRNVTVTATRTQKLIEEIPASVDLIGEKEIARMDPQNVGEALENLKGVMIKSYGGLGSTQTISLRGSSSEQVLILIDGQRVNNAQNGQVDLSNLPANDIEKIEIVKGANSALYGSDAVGGVINIITRSREEKDKLSVSAKAMLGSFNSQSYGSSFSYSGNVLSLNASYKYLYSEGDYMFTDNFGLERRRLNADIRSHSFNTGVRYRFTEHEMQPDISLNYDHYRSERGAPGTIEPYYYDARMWDRTHNVYLNANSKVFNQFNDIKFMSSYHTTWNRYFNDEMLVPADNIFSTKSMNAEIQGHSVISDHVILTYGAGQQYNTMYDQQIDTSYQRVTLFAFILDETSFEFRHNPYLNSFTVSPSLRFDSHSDFSDVLSPKIGFVLNMGEEWKTGIKSNFGLSYRAPTFNDLYWPEDDYTVGNPDLEPEYGRDWDIGLRLQYPVLDGMYLESAYFHNRMTNLIIWESGGEKWIPDNVDEALIEGVENGLRLDIIDAFLRTDLNYTYLHAVNLSENPNEYGKQLVYRPKHSFNFSLLGIYRNFSLQYKFNYTSKRYINRTNVELNALPAYSVSDLIFTFSPRIRDLDIDLNMQIKNLFNADYRIMKNLPMPGREYRMSVEVKLNKKTNKRRKS
ncbi:MAG: TonB-dependent receptor plug domain-containing protein, partial [Fidelibacterota bacterium]